MKGKITAMLGLLTLSLILLTMASPARASLIGEPKWVEPAYVGDDYYYDEGRIVGYLTGTYWNFSFSWVNDHGDPQNISAARMYFDWGKNYTYSYSTPLMIMPGMTQTWTVSNMTPPIAEAPELWTHDYYLYLDTVNSTVAPYGPLSSLSVTHGHNFAVLSADHLACLNIWFRLGHFMFDGPMVTMQQTGTMPSITRVQILMMQASMEFEQGMSIFDAGVFGTAKTHLQSAESLFNDALTAWDERGTAMEDAELNATKAETNYYNAQADATRKLADASIVNAYGWLFFGIGWTFIGIGIIVYGLRRPKVAPPS
jgi:hypothetical protein